MTETISSLRDERARLQARLKQLDELLERYDAWEREASSLLSGVAPAQAEVQRTTPADQQVAIEVSEGTPLPEFIEAAERMFRETDRPLPRTDAFAKLREAGVVVVGKDPYNTMTTRLHRMGNIINIKGHGYWMKDRPYPTAGYDPSGSEGGDDLSTETELPTADEVG